MSPLLPSLRPVVLLALLSSGCGGSMKASASGSASSDAGAEGETNFDVESESAWEMTENTQSSYQTSSTSQPSSPQSTATISREKPLLGARHDLLLAEGSPETCRCLAVILGGASAPAFVWTGRRPAVDPATQLVVALASEGIECAGASSGASYMGYETKDGDVIVHVEAAVKGRPVTHGAVIPRPGAGKQVFIEPAGNIPYGKSLDGSARCALGNGG